MTSPILWQASAERKENSALGAFLKKAEILSGQNFAEFSDLHKWSVENWQTFWQQCASFLKIHWTTPPTEKTYLSSGSHMTDGTWFPDAELNYAENVLIGTADLEEAVCSFDETGLRARLSGKELARQVQAVQYFLKVQGIGKGDRVVGVTTNGDEALIAFLATSSLGAIWASCSPDFGEQAILDRMQQIEPKVLFYSANYRYGGKVFSCTEKIKSCLAKLSSVKAAVAIAAEGNDHYRWEDIRQLRPEVADKSIMFTPVAFDHPLYILFSSGTTGKPKCIVHAHGRSLLQHRKEHVLHCDLKPGEKILYYTTCGWMMWNWLVSALASQASIVLYDGSPNFPAAESLWKLVDSEGVAILGTSPRFLQYCEKNQVVPANLFKLAKLKTILSTGSPLAASQFEWVYKNIKADLHLASISGGTDIVACFVLGNILSPVRAGEIQGPGLGMAVEAWDKSGHRVIGQKGELVCTRPFISMPVAFWQDPNKIRYRASYFEKFPDVWCHGDFLCESKEGGYVILGRSDATLNPGGVRIGTAEIYGVVEGMDGIADALTVSQSFGDDLRIILFVQLGNPSDFNEAFAEKIKAAIRKQLSPRHVPHIIKAVTGIPYTRSGKKMEIAVKNIIEGNSVDNKAAVANPEVLVQFEKIAEDLHEA